MKVQINGLSALEAKLNRLVLKEGLAFKNKDGETLHTIVVSGRWHLINMSSWVTSPITGAKLQELVNEGHLTLTSGKRPLANLHHLSLWQAPPNELWLVTHNPTATELSRFVIYPLGAGGDRAGHFQSDLRAYHWLTKEKQAVYVTDHYCLRPI